MPGEYDGTKGYETDDVVDLGGRVLETVRGYRYYLGKRTVGAHAGARASAGAGGRLSGGGYSTVIDSIDDLLGGVVGVNRQSCDWPSATRAPEIRRGHALVQDAAGDFRDSAAPHEMERAPCSLPAASLPRSFVNSEAMCRGLPEVAPRRRGRRPGRTCSASDWEGRLLRRARGAARSWQMAR